MTTLDKRLEDTAEDVSGVHLHQKRQYENGDNGERVERSLLTGVFEVPATSPSSRTIISSLMDC